MPLLPHNSGFRYDERATCLRKGWRHKVADSTDVTTILNALEAGDASAADRLIPLVYDELRALAQSFMQRERPDHTLQATALVNEAYLRMVEQPDREWRNRAHFFAVAAQAIRRILVDHAREQGAIKRGGHHHRVSLEIGTPDRNQGESLDLVELDSALRELGSLDQRQARIVELRYFGGLSIEETARLLDVSIGTVKGDWRIARAWLREHLSR